MKPLRVIDTQINKSVRIILKYPSFGPSFAVAIIDILYPIVCHTELPNSAERPRSAFHQRAAAAAIYR
ncbi:hypothetical protein PC111_g19883 [Phytophthora cactorum]|nr:hypothetical protein PC111_g19883 [Phytophthora cactorum]